MRAGKRGDGSVKGPILTRQLDPIGEKVVNVWRHGVRWAVRLGVVPNIGVTEIVDEKVHDVRLRGRRKRTCEESEHARQPHKLCKVIDDQQLLIFF